MLKVFGILSITFQPTGYCHAADCASCEHILPPVPAQVAFVWCRRLSRSGGRVPTVFAAVPIMPEDFKRIVAHNINRPTRI